MKRHQIAYLIVIALLVLAPVQAEATSHTTSLTQLCKWIVCQPALTIAPKIAQADSPVTPGGYVVIQGSGFGQAEGDVLLTGFKNYLGTGYWTPLIIPPSKPPWDFWTPTQVIVQVPHSLTQGTDQQVELQIKTKNGLSSNKFPVNFKATRDIKVLPASSVHSISCSPEADSDRCNNVKHTNFIIFCSSPVDYAEGGTFFGFHWTCVGDSDGDDSFRFSLREKYGWSLVSPDLVYSTGGVDPPVIESGSQDWGVTYTKVSLHWNNATVSYVSYRVDVSIIGPKGVPHY